MADPISHIKDSYYFEVPKFLWRPDYVSLDDVPAFLRQTYPDASVEEFNEAMAGKVLIPQPFAELEYLDKKKSGFGISKFMVMELVAALLLMAIFIPLARRIKKDVTPQGRSWNLFESFLLFIRDQVARPAIGKHDANRFLPLLWTLFFFVLTCNLLGLVPWAGSATGALATTGALALITFGFVIGSGMVKLGPLGFWKAQVPHMHLPFVLAVVLIPMIFAIEVMGIFIKHTILAVRL